MCARSRNKNAEVTTNTQPTIICRRACQRLLGPNILEMFRRAASYVDQIARGAKPSDLPVEQPTKFEFVLNLKTAKAIGLATPTALLLRVEEVIE